MVGDLSAASTCGSACGRTRGGAYDARELKRRGGKGSVAHCGCKGANGELRGELERLGRRGGSSATEVEDKLGAASPGRASTRGWVEAKQQTTVELLGTARQRVDGGGCGGACQRRRLCPASGKRVREARQGGEWSGRGVQGVGVALVDASGASAEAGGGRRVAVGAGHAPLVLLARGGG